MVRICRVDSTYQTQNIYFISVSDTIDTYKTSLLKTHTKLIDVLLGKEAVGTLDECTYLDVDSSDKRQLKNTLLWRRNKR